MSHTREVGSPRAALALGVVDAKHLPLYYPRGRDDAAARRVGFSLHNIVQVDCAKNKLHIPSALLDPRDVDCYPGVETLVYAYKFQAETGEVIAVPRPLIKTNARGLVGSSDSAAVVWADGSVIYAWNGVWIHPDVFERPEKITPQLVQREKNAEVRRCMMEHYPGGCKELIARWAKEGAAQIIDRDADSMGERILFALSDLERYVMVTTVDVSGTEKLYLLRVLPSITTCSAAVASTFPTPEGFRYAPVVES